METSDGMLGRKLLGIFNKTNFKKFDLKSYVISEIEFKKPNIGYNFAYGIIDIAKKSEKFKANDLNKRLEDLKNKDQNGDYFYSMNINLISARISDL